MRANLNATIEIVKSIQQVYKKAFSSSCFSAIWHNICLHYFNQIFAGKFDVATKVSFRYIELFRAPVIIMKQ